MGGASSAAPASSTPKPARRDKRDDRQKDRQNEKVRLDLTPEQRAQVKRQTGKDAEALELNVEALEGRIAQFAIRR